MLKTTTADTKQAAARGNSKPQSAASTLQQLTLIAPGNQATLRLMRKCDCDSAPDCNCDMGDAKKKRDKDSPKTALHRAAESPSTPERVPPIVGETLRSPGQTLDPQTQAFFEARFGEDFSGVRIHTDPRAAESAQAVHALAYTVGKDIAFAPGRFSPSTLDGRRLLAHELSHTVQQRDVPCRSTPIGISPNNGPEERSADARARPRRSR